MNDKKECKTMEIISYYKGDDGKYHRTCTIIDSTPKEELK